MILIRKYKGETHRVEVINVGAYRYNGETYPTQTRISWKIAPYKISGNTFFGLPVKNASKERATGCSQQSVRFRFHAEASTFAAIIACARNLIRYR